MTKKKRIMKLHNEINGAIEKALKEKEPYLSKNQDERNRQIEGIVEIVLRSYELKLKEMKNE